MSKTKDTIIDEQNAQQPDFVKELLKNGYVTLKAKTRDELAEMVNDIPADIKYGVGCVGQNFEEGCFTLRIDITNN